MVEVSILGFMVSGAFLGFVYLDVIYQMIGLVVVLKVLLQSERRAYFEASHSQQDNVIDVTPESELAAV
jgi:hypothetical protein